MVIGSIAQFSDKSSVLLEVTALRREINLKPTPEPTTCPRLQDSHRRSAIHGRALDRGP
jgi:hypothetical protein